MNTLKTLILLTVLFSCLGQLSAQEWTSYKSIQQSNDFFDAGDELLLATDAGLVIVDKNTLDYSIFNMSNTNLSNDHIQSLAQSSSGETFIGTYDMVVARFDGSDFHDPVVPDGINDINAIELYDLKVSESGDVWLATSEGVFRQTESEWIKYAHNDLGPDFFEVWDIEFDATGQLYIAAGNGILKFENDAWTNISLGIDFLAYSSADLFFSQEGDLFLTGDLEKIARFDGEEWTIYSNGGVNGSEIRGFSEDIEGNIYFDTWYDGIYKLEGDSWVLHEDEQTALYPNLISFYHIDAEGTHWLNSGIHLSAKENDDLKTMTISSTTIEYNDIYNIGKGPDGTMYFLMRSSSNRIATLSPDGEWSYLSVPFYSFPYYAFCYDILVRAEDDIYFAVQGGFYHYNGIDWTLHFVGSCELIVEDSKGRVFIKGLESIHIIENGIVSTYDSSNSPILSGLKIGAIGVDTEDNLWIGAYEWNLAGNHLIYKVSPEGEWTTYNGFDHSVIKYPKGEFYFDANGDVWVSCFLGVLKFDGQDFVNPLLGNPFGFQNLFAYTIKSDAEGRIYFATQAGVITYYEGQWEEWINTELKNPFSWSITIEFDDSGTLWWGNGMDGLYSFEPVDITNTYSLSQDAGMKVFLYPNPTHNETTIKYSLVEDAEVSIDIYNKMGQRVSIFDLGFLHKGSHEKRLNLSNYPAGMYTIQLRQGEHISIAKLIID